MFVLLHSRSRLAIVALASAAALPAPAALAAKPPASRAAERAHLLRLVHRHPSVLNHRWFVKRASLVNFVLPATVRLRDGGTSAATMNTNKATIDLGASLGNREVDLNGKLAARIVFHDSYDGGALGNVDVELPMTPSSSSYGLRTTSVPLLWNQDISHTTDPFNNNAPIAFPQSCASFTTGVDNQPAGIDDLTQLQASKAPGDDDLGGNAQPFPSGEEPGLFNNPPTIADTVLRTNSLRLLVADPSDPAVNASNPVDGNGPQGSQNIVEGRSGGQANLFGNIPGKSVGIDVTVSLTTKISSILREVDPDPQTVTSGQPWPAYTLACRQVWTGWVQNYLPDIRLVGSLKIAPAITSDGHMRIAKASLTGLTPTNMALAACLQPDSAYANPANSSDTTPITAPTQPLSTSAARPAPDVPCNSPASDQLISSMGLGALPQNVISDIDPSVTFSGAQASVAGRISVDTVNADILLGDV